MKKAFSLQIFLFLIFLVIQKSLDAQIRPRVIECPVNSISPTVLDAGSGSGQVYPTVTVSTLNNCTTYTISCSYSWISYSRNGLYITVSVQANTGPARTGYVNIGDKTLTVNQACGNNPVEPKRLYVDRNNICADAGGVINLSVIGGSGSATRWFTGACGGTQIGYTDGTSIEIDAPTETTTYYARWETTCGNSNCKQITVTVYPSPIPTISGPSSACLNSSGNVYTTEADMTGYSWTVTGGTITSGGGSTDNSVTVIWTTQGIGHVKVNYTNSNGCTAENQTDNPVTILPETEILSQPANINIQQYQEAVFTVLATGTNLQYQWQASSAPEGTWTNLNSLPASGYNTDTLTMYWQSTTQYTLFRCQIISDCDTVFSNIGILTIDLPETNYLTGNNILDPETRTLNQSYPVGTTNGFLNVNSFGSATYEVPIYIAPGTTGMQPSLSIAYNSHGKIGLLGQRWDLNGLSEIHRVPKDIYHDNEVNGINLQNTDMFALDSNRLVLTSQHAYGADGSEYTTEYETFARISAHDTAGTGPSWFKVETKDGRTIEYGNSTGSKVEALGSNTVYRWRINKVYDQYGNTIKYSYNEANGESFISQIDYTANDSANLTTPYNSIKFDYALRTDKNSKYVGGSKIPQTVLLTEIKAQADNDSIVRKYEFKYFLDSLNISYLNEIVEYGEDDAHLNSTVIGWGSPTSHFMSEDVFNNSTINNYYLGDFNGDGLTDFVVTPKKTSYTSNDKWKLYFSEDSLGLGFAFITEGNLDSEFKGFYVANNDGDRKDDIFWKNVTAGSVNFLNYTGNNYTDFGRGDTIYDLKFLGADASTYLMPGDFNGDGISDYLVLYSSLHLLNAIVNGTSKNGISFSNPDDVRIIDFDGDGRQEVLVIDGNNSIIYQYSSSSQSFSTIYTSATFPTNSYRIYPSDFNGDKKTDLLTWKSGTGWQIYFSTGTGFALSGSTPPMTDTDPEGSLADNNYYVSDFNGDGKSDVLEAYKYSTSSILNVFYSIGDGIFSEEIYNYSKSSINQDYFKFGDFNGDGKHDIFFYDYSQSSNSVNLCLFHKDELKNMVECIANGLNYKTKIIYNRLNKGAPFYGIINYDSEYPVYDYKGSYYAVSSIECDNGTGGTINQVYLWEKAKIHRQGRGFLGFSQETITDTAHYSRSLKNFNINPTYYNRYLSEEVVFNYFPGWVLDTLSKITYTDSVKYFGSTSIFPYVSQTVNQDLLLKNTVTTTNRYDDYGNLTGFKVMYQNDEDGHVVEAVKSITNDFEQYGNYGIPNKITGVIDSSQYTGQSVYVRETEFSYNNKGNLTSSTTDPSKSKAVTTTYSYNDFGLPTEVSISSSGLTRTTSMTYDPTSRFITETTNPAGQISEKSYDSKTGNVLTETGIDYLTTQFVYDGFGRLIETITPQSKHIYTTTEWDTLNNGGANSLFYIISDADSIPYTKIYYDILGRELKSETEGINGIVYQEKVYKSNGYLSQKSRPHLSPESVKWNYFDYDSNGRLIKDSTSFHDFKYNYSDKTTTIFRPNSEYKTIFKNSIGNTNELLRSKLRSI